MSKQPKCKKCGKRVTRRNFGSGGGYGRLLGEYGYVRCRACTVDMLRGAKPVGDGFLRSDG